MTFCIMIDNLISFHYDYYYNYLVVV